MLLSAQEYQLTPLDREIIRQLSGEKAIDGVNIKRTGVYYYTNEKGEKKYLRYFDRKPEEFKY